MTDLRSNLYVNVVNDIDSQLATLPGSAHESVCLHLLDRKLTVEEMLAKRKLATCNTEPQVSVAVELELVTQPCPVLVDCMY